jgi:hypothetical protein
MFVVFALAACGGASPSSAPAPSLAPAASSAPAVVSGASVPGGAAQPAAPDVNALLQTLAQAAQLGGTFKVTETDLKLSGVETENIIEFAGAESQLSAENGGIVVVIRAKEGTTATVAGQMEAFRDSRLGNPDYVEFETARGNTAAARIEVFGDMVVYAVSAAGHEGGWDALDAAIAAAFAG